MGALAQFCELLFFLHKLWQDYLLNFEVATQAYIPTDF